MVEKVEMYKNGLEKLLQTGIAKAKSGDTLVYNRYTNELEGIKLSAKQRLALKLRGFAYIGDRQYPGWSGKIAFYVYKCKVDKKEALLVDYPHGYNEALRCSIN